MKRLEISEETRRQFEHNTEWWKWVHEQWVKEGFDMTKSINQYMDPMSRHVIFTQEN